MRWLVLCVLVLVSSSSLRASAQEASTLQLELDAAGVDAVASPARTSDGYTLKEMERRVQRARRGLGASVVPFVAGGIFMTVGTVGGGCFFNSDPPTQCNRMLYSGVGLAAVGAAGMIATGILLGVRKRRLRTLREAAYYDRRRRAEWDPALSRLVF
jgi:hypothetical protein